jgi:DNA-binding response OmpR family regulator
MESLRVLVVDDQPDVVDLLCVLLRQLGLECRTAETGEDALRVAQEFAPHIVFLDIGLPDITGYDVARSIRAGGSGAYIVAVTGWGSEQDVQKAFDAGFDEHIMKPANAAKLRAAVAKAGKERGLSNAVRSKKHT